jgi:sarcosine oxidase, subunit beta
MTPNLRSADVVIIGGGIVGTSAAYQLSRMQAGRMILVEREGLLGAGSTGRCAGGFRHQFSTEINMRLSLLSAPMILSFSADMGCPIDLHQDGYLFLLSNPADVALFQANIALQNSIGIPSQYLQPDEIVKLAPHLSVEGLVGGAFCEWDGIADPNGMTQGYASAARRSGVEIRTGTAATGIALDGSRVTGLHTDQGFIPCGALVNAAGPHAREVAGWAGVDLPVHPERRHVYTTAPFTEAPADFLMAIDFATTFYCHRESGGILMGMGNSEETSSFSLNVDSDFLERVLEVALKRYPGLSGAHVNRAWAGLYEMSPDAHPILGRAGAVENLYLANGFSGHGFQHAPIVGKLIAEEILLGRSQTLDITPLRLERFEAPTTKELNVV